MGLYVVYYDSRNLLLCFFAGESQVTKQVTKKELEAPLGLKNELYFKAILY